MASEFSKPFEKAGDEVSRRSERVVRGMETMAERAADGLGETAENLRHVANDGLDRVEVAIRRNPLASAAIAAGIGFVCAALARR